jgi:hypothetical protein
MSPETHVTTLGAILLKFIHTKNILYKQELGILILDFHRGINTDFLL